MPTDYTPINDYSDELGTTHGLHLDQDFASVASSIATVTDSLALVQRGDGKLQDVSVQIHTLSQEVLNLIGGYSVRGIWTDGAVYAVKDLVDDGTYSYACITEHTAVTSLDASKFIRFGFTSGADATIAAAAAQASRDSAIASAATATTQAGIATTQAGIATTKAGSATSSASAAAASALSASGSATSASASATAANLSAVSATASAAIAAAVVEPALHAATTKATPVDADELPLVDSAASWALKKFTWANLKSVLKTYFDTLYTTPTSGTFSPDIQGETGTISVLTGTWYKNGNVVTVSIELTGTSIAFTLGTAYINNPPFDCPSNVPAQLHVSAGAAVASLTSRGIANKEYGGGFWLPTSAAASRVHITGTYITT